MPAAAVPRATRSFSENPCSFANQPHRWYVQLGVRPGASGVPGRTFVDPALPSPTSPTSYHAQRKQFASRTPWVWICPMLGQTAVVKGLQWQSSTSTASSPCKVLPVLPEPLPIQSGVQVVPGQHLIGIALAHRTSPSPRARRPALRRLTQLVGEVLLHPSKRPPSRHTRLMTRHSRRSPRERRPSMMDGRPRVAQPDGLAVLPVTQGVLQLPQSAVDDPVGA